MKYIQELRKRFSSTPVFSIQDIKKFFASRHISEAYVHVLVSNLHKRNEIVRLAKGVYSFQKDLNLVGKAILPSYHGLQDALTIHGLWQQQSNIVLITPRKIRSGLRTVLGTNVLIRRIKRPFFFGFELKNFHGQQIWVSDPEKTLLDFFYFNEPLDKTVLPKIKKRIDRQKLGQYLKKAPKNIQKRVLQTIEPMKKK